MAVLRYVLFNKPFHVLSQFTKGTDVDVKTIRATLADYISIPAIYPVGRLDYDSEGLLLLTNDGPLQHRLTDPRFEHPRTYWVQVEGAVTAEAIAQLENGVVFGGRKTKKCKAASIPIPSLPPRHPPVRYRAEIPTSWLQITLTEGRNRQVRRMTAAVGFPALRLVRVAIGHLTLGDLSPGGSRELTEDERALLFRQTTTQAKGRSESRPPLRKTHAPSQYRR